MRSSLIGQQHLDAYSREGCVLIEDAFRDWVAPLCAAIDRVLEKSRRGDVLEPVAPDAGLSLHVVEQFGGGTMASCLIPYDSCFTDFLQRSPAEEIVKKVMQSALVRPRVDTVFIKEGRGSAGHTPWHNDTPALFDGYKVCVLWIALSDVTKADSPLVTVRGSHKTNARFTDAPGETPEGWRPLQELIDHATSPEAHKQIWCMSAGDCLVMHASTFHCSLPSAEGAERRVAWTIRWFGDDVRPAAPATPDRRRAVTPRARVRDRDAWR